MAKTYRHLYPQIWDWDNLLLAYRKARQGKRARLPAATFEFYRKDRQSPSAGAGHAKKEPFVTDGSFLRPTTPRSQIDVPSTPCYNQRIITTLAQTLDERKR